MSYFLPQDGRWIQANKGDKLGLLRSSYNLNLVRNRGAVGGTRLIHDNSTSADLANLGLPVGFVKFNTGVGLANAPYFTVAGTRVFYTNAGTIPSVFGQDATSGTPTNCDSSVSDLMEFNTSLYVTAASTTVYKLDSGGSWSNFVVTNAGTTNHMLCVYGGRMYMQVGLSQIFSWGTNDTETADGATYSLQLSSATFGDTNQNVITFIKAVSNGMWIGTLNSLGGKGHIYFWNGVTANTPQSIYVLDSVGAMSCVIKDDIPYIMDANGVLRVFNGGTFQELARLPIYNGKTLNGTLNQANERWIHPQHGMDIVEGRINMNLSLTLWSNSTQNEETAPSGIWEYDSDIGLYHKYSPSYYEKDTAAITDYGQQRLVSSTGAGNIGGAGGIYALTNIAETTTRNGTLLAGFKYYTDATATQFGIFYDDTLCTVQTALSFTTEDVPASSLVDMWNRVYARHKVFLDTSDKIVIKYRVAKEAPIEGTITWGTTTRFSTALDISDYAVGDEVEILQGTGSGMCSHITDINVDTVTLDETHTGVTGTAIARFQKWKKAGVIQDVKDIGSAVIDESATAIQIKVFALFTGKNEIYQLIVDNKKSEKL